MLVYYICTCRVWSPDTLILIGAVMQVTESFDLIWLNQTGSLGLQFAENRVTLDSSLFNYQLRSMKIMSLVLSVCVSVSHHYHGYHGVVGNYTQSEPECSTRCGCTPIPVHLQLGSDARCTPHVYFSSTPRPFGWGFISSSDSTLFWYSWFRFRFQQKMESFRNRFRFRNRNRASLPHSLWAHCSLNLTNRFRQMNSCHCNKQS